ncbi:type II toxin-antitoxin system RelE/ParE family toxin [Candidatus Pacearchaeota archaeon]|nr:type II toxin-antitoxin system RelE/ParE family toxin [Candidatus Pacearchaeota archaeon]
MYEVQFSSTATKFFKNLPQDIQNRIRKKFKEIEVNPMRYLEHYEGDHHKIRIGDYRALIDIDHHRKVLVVQVFDKRGRIYQ